MKDITVNASKNYHVTIGSGVLTYTGEVLRRLTKATKAAIVSDSNVWPLYGETVTESLRHCGIEVMHFVFPAGEAQKNGNTYLELLSFLADRQLTRSDCLIALGGGVVGDLTGFAAATYLRGIPYIQLPTSLLAMVDSSVGGKTAIDLPGGKNLAGAFYQPTAVLCDTDTLKSLPDGIFRDGCAEVIKYGILYDPVLFAHLEEKGLGLDREAVIARCVELKRDVVMEDEFDTGPRQKLNLGHTIGHGIEAASHFTVSHGKAVAAGMAIVARASSAYEICCVTTAELVVQILEQFGLPTGTDFSAEELYRTALSDKKRTGRTVNLIVPKTIGNCVIHPIPVEEMLSFIKAGL